MKLIDWAGDLLFPPRCTFCKRLLEPVEKGAGVCDDCASQINFTRHMERKVPLVDHCICALDYEDLVRDAIRDYKFNGRRSNGETFARLMLYAARQKELEWDLLSYVPTNPKNLRRRGFHHTLLLAQYIGREQGSRPVSTLKKIRETKAMFGLEPAARRANILGALALDCDPALIAGKRVLLAEDVVTTGATAEECARVLKTAGAAQVSVLALAGAVGQDSAK